MILLEENIGTKLLDMGFGNVFLDMIPKYKQQNKKINKWDYIKLKRFCTMKKTLTNEKTTYGMGKNICKPCIW